MSDLHLNVAKRTEEARRVAEWIRDDAQARGVHFFGIAGDVMDGPMTELDRAWLQGFLRSCADIAPVFVVPGNHDSRFSLERFATRLHGPGSGFETAWPIYVEPAAGVHWVDTANGAIAVAGVAFPWKAEILARLGCDTSVEDADRVAEDALRQVFLGMGVKVRELGLPTVALVHAAIRGSKLSDDQPARPLGLEIPVEDLAQVGASFYAVGHVHAKNEFEFNGVKIWTPTSPFFTDWGEAKHEKGYIWLEMDPSIIIADADLCNYVTKVQRVPTPVTPMILIEVEIRDEVVRCLNKEWDTDQLLFVDAAGSDLRLRFHYPKEQEKTAKAIAEHWADEYRAQGAISVTLDPVPDPIIRARISGLSTAVTLEEKASLYRESTDAKVPEGEQKALDSILQEIHEELAAEGVSFGIQSRGVPTLKRIRGKGWLCFPDEFNIDVERLGELTAIVAPNETGKSLWMSLCGPGLLYGDTPNRGSLDDLSRARDAFIEGVFTMGEKEYRLGQVSNAMVKTNKGHVNLTAEGKSVLQKAGREEYKAWVKKNLLPWNQYLSLLFHSGSEDDGGRKINIIDMKDSARTELMLKVLGIEFYEAVAKKARDRANAVNSELDRVNARLSELGQDNVGQLEAAVGESREGLIQEHANLARAEDALAQQRQQSLAIEKRRAERDALLQHQTNLKDQEARLREKIADVETRIANNQEVIDQAQAIRDAHVEVDSLTQQLDNLQETERELQTAASKIENVLDLANRDYETHTATDKRLLAEVQALDSLVAQKPSVQATIDSIPEFEKAVRECIEDRDRALGEYEDVQARGMADLSERHGFLRLELGVIAKKEVAKPHLYAQEALDADDLQGKAAAEHPALLLQAKAAWQQRDERAKEAIEQLARLKREAERMADIEAAETKGLQTEKELDTVRLEMAAIKEKIDTKTVEREEYATKIETTSAKAKEVDAEIQRLQPLANKLSILESAETRVAELTQQRGDVQSDLDGVVDQLARLQIPDIPASPAITPYAQAVASAQTAMQLATSWLAVAEKALSDAKAKEQRVTELNAQAGQLRTKLDRCNRIAREFGVDGLQKEEIAAAGSNLTAIVNELLRAGGDMDHTVDIRTERPHSRENRQIPCFEIMVSDSRIDGGAPKEARRLSGYGQTVIGKALSMAMTRLGCERAGIHSCTIWFDELCGTATPDNAVRIIGMLRRFAEDLKAKIFFVDQNPDIQALADSQIEIREGGKIEVS